MKKQIMWECTVNHPVCRLGHELNYYYVTHHQAISVLNQRKTALLSLHFINSVRI